MNMSVWADMHRRSTGVQERKENRKEVYENAWLAEEVGLKLKSFKVYPGGCPPIKMVYVLVRNKSGYVSMKSALCASVTHSDGSRDFCSSQNIGKIIECIGDGEFLGIN